jgi:hypothetical protein
MADPPRSPVIAHSNPSSARETEESGSSQVQADEGCPLCRRTSIWDEKHRFWFLHENYSFPETLERLTRSLGVCFFHGAHAALDPSGQSSLTFVHNVLARRVGAILSRDPVVRSSRKKFHSSFAFPDPCPACEERNDALGRELSSLTPEIEQAESDSRALMGSLCFPHFRVLVSRLSRQAISRLLPVYESALSAAMDTAREEQESDAGAQSDRRSEGNDPLSSALHHAVGDDGMSGLFPPSAGPKKKPAIRNPVADFREDLCTDDACPVCKEMSRAWAEWMAWLTDNIPGGDAVRDLLPVCPMHLQAAFRLGNRHLATASINHVLRLARRQVRRGEKALSTSPMPGRKISFPGLGRLFPRDERPFPEVRRSIARPLPCPVCHRLSVARDRVTFLLFALLESPRHQSRFEEGYGLCLKHFSRALFLKPSERVRTILMEGEASKLALLQWELEESMRKDAWMFRPEAAGTERTAWIGAVRRFSGSFPECEE